MARAGEHIEAYLTAADQAKLAALVPLIERAPAEAGVSRYRVRKRPAGAESASRLA